jgi:phosphatidylserine/phosphatidylglycerophosphate/cardiolipin synthase-like enzyme
MVASELETLGDLEHEFEEEAVELAPLFSRGEAIAQPFRDKEWGLPLRSFKPPCQAFLPANTSNNYEDYVAAPTTGRVTLMINGRTGGVDHGEAFESMQNAVESLGRGDSIYLAAWQFNPATVPLDKGCGVKTWGDLFQRKANQGVKIRIIITQNIPTFMSDLNALNTLIGKLGLSVRDNFKYTVSKHPATFGIHAGTHHQKFMVVRKACGETMAFCGGLDLASPRHPCSWTTSGFVWHDIHAKLQGLIARDLEREFVLRWNREAGSPTATALPGWRAFEKLVQAPAGSVDRRPSNNTNKLQMLRTVSIQGTGWNVQRTTRDDILQGYLRLIGCATRFIFMENQYYRERLIADAIVKQGKIQPKLIVIIVVSTHDDPNDPLLEHGKALQNEFFTRLFAGFDPTRLRVYTMFSRLVHSKLILADDHTLCMGSANANPRGFLLDTELNVMLDDAETVKSFRHRLWSHDLGVPQDRVAGWAPPDFLAQWDAIASDNNLLTYPAQPNKMTGEGVVPFYLTSVKGIKLPLPDVLFEINDWNPSTVSVKRKQARYCRNCAPPRSAQNVLLVGAERVGEFAQAMRLARQGHGVVAINPRETASARAFRRAGGRFIRARLEDLPPECCRFDLICENYPYPSGRHYVPPRAFAIARLARLKPGGRWILVTESPRYASLLKAVGAHDGALRSRFRSTLTPLSIDEAPPSAYPRADTRFRLVFRRCR